MGLLIVPKISKLYFWYNKLILPQMGHLQQENIHWVEGTLPKHDNILVCPRIIQNSKLRMSHFFLSNPKFFKLFSCLITIRERPVKVNIYQNKVPQYVSAKDSSLYDGHVHLSYQLIVNHKEWEPWIITWRLISNPRTCI